MKIFIFLLLSIIYSIPNYGQGPTAQKDQFGKWGLVSEEGRDLTDFEFDNMKVAGPYFLVESYFAWGALDQNGQIIVPQEYLDIRVSGPDMFIVKKGATFGILNQKGQTIMEPELEAVQYIRNDGSALIKKDGEWSYFKNNERIDDEPIFEIVDKMPLFTACPTCSRKDEEHQSQKDMLTFIYTNIKYPAEARENAIQGTVVVSFIVDKTGQIIEPEVTRSLADDCDKEALRVIKLMKKWAPAEMDGKPVSCRFRLPIKYKLR